MRRGSLLAALLGAVVTAAGCGVYSTSSGRVEASRQRVAVPYLENLTAQPNLGVELTDLIINALQEDNTLKVVGEDAASGVIEGRVTHYNRRQVSTGADLRVDEYQIQIAVELTFRVKNDPKPIFERKQFTGTGNYFLDDPETTEESARGLAATEIVRDILAQVVEDW